MRLEMCPTMRGVVVLLLAVACTPAPSSSENRLDGDAGVTGAADGSASVDSNAGWGAGDGGAFIDADAGQPSDAGPPDEPDGGGAMDAGPELGEGCLAPSPGMTFFVTHQGTGALGGNMGGLAGADAICQTAAQAVGITGRTWRAYLSANDDGNGSPVHARDRIGGGPWLNHAGLSIGNLTDIHTLREAAVPIERVLSECGARFSVNTGVDGFFQAHDVITGSNHDGTLVPGKTCQDWTSSDSVDEVQIGHCDHDVPDDFWNSSHDTRCDEEGLNNTAGIGRLYCFAP